MSELPISSLSFMRAARLLCEWNVIIAVWRIRVVHHTKQETGVLFRAKRTRTSTLSARRISNCQVCLYAYSARPQISSCNLAIAMQQIHAFHPYSARTPSLGPKRAPTYLIPATGTRTRTSTPYIPTGLAFNAVEAAASPNMGVIQSTLRFATWLLGTPEAVSTHGMEAEVNECVNQ